MKQTRKNKKLSSPYKGILATPFPDFGLGIFEESIFTTSEQSKEAREKWATEEWRRMVALLDHYRIPHVNLYGAETWYSLALVLAYEHLDAFKPSRPKRGPGRLWNEFTLACLVVDVRRLREGNGAATLKNLCAQLEAREPWRSFIRRKNMGRGLSYDPGETLYRNLKKAQRDRTVMALAAVAWKAYQHDPEDWPSTVTLGLGSAQKHQRLRK